VNATNGGQERNLKPTVLHRFTSPVETQVNAAWLRRIICKVVIERPSAAQEPSSNDALGRKEERRRSDARLRRRWLLGPILPRIQLPPRIQVVKIQNRIKDERIRPNRLPSIKRVDRE
jgi:hypothetical protein